MSSSILPAQRFLIVTLLVTMIGGCSESQEWLTEEGKSLGLQAASARSGSATRIAKPRTADRPFEPLYPKRRNPFVYGGELAAISPESTPTRLSKTLVLGFVTIDQPRVILSLHGRPYTLSIGESVGNIRVEQIAPPTVTLRSGHSTWTASMFD